VLPQAQGCPSCPSLARRALWRDSKQGQSAENGAVSPVKIIALDNLTELMALRAAPSLVPQNEFDEFASQHFSGRDLPIFGLGGPREEVPSQAQQVFSRCAVTLNRWVCTPGCFLATMKRRRVADWTTTSVCDGPCCCCFPHLDQGSVGSVPIPFSGAIWSPITTLPPQNHRVPGVLCQFHANFTPVITRAANFTRVITPAITVRAGPPAMLSSDPRALGALGPTRHSLGTLEGMAALQHLDRLLATCHPALREGAAVAEKRRNRNEMSPSTHPTNPPPTARGRPPLFLVLCAIGVVALALLSARPALAQAHTPVGTAPWARDALVLDCTDPADPGTATSSPSTSCVPPMATADNSGFTDYCAGPTTEPCDNLAWVFSAWSNWLALALVLLGVLWSLAGVLQVGGLHEGHRRASGLTLIFQRVQTTALLGFVVWRLGALEGVVEALLLQHSRDAFASFEGTPSFPPNGFLSDASVILLLVLLQLILFWVSLRMVTSTLLGVLALSGWSRHALGEPLRDLIFWAAVLVGALQLPHLVSFAASLWLS
jgi:hypothetical protein